VGNYSQSWKIAFVLSIAEYLKMASAVVAFRIGGGVCLNVFLKTMVATPLFLGLLGAIERRSGRLPAGNTVCVQAYQILQRRFAATIQ
jgi:hypothetical protein